MILSLCITHTNTRIVETLTYRSGKVCYKQSLLRAYRAFIESREQFKQNDQATRSKGQDRAKRLVGDVLDLVCMDICQ